jgi:glutamyl-tRNA reductase
MRLLLVGVSHHTAPVEIREQVAFSKAKLPDALAALARASATGEAVVLSTCNRAEVYTTADDVSMGRQALARFLSQFHEVSFEQLDPHLYSQADGDAVRHLFRVAAGLDSLVVGEPQILGQVKDAYQAASDARTTGPTLNKLFHWSFAVGKRVRSGTGLGEGAVSVSFAAVSLAKKIFGKLEGRPVLLVGAGEMSKLTAQHLQAQDAGPITIVSRTAEHAQALADALGGVAPMAAGWSDIDRLLAAADIVITATGAPVPVLTRARIEHARRTRRGAPLFLIDIAVPRDVEPSAGELDEVFLYDIDDLLGVVAENVSRRSGQVASAEAMVHEETTRFLAWLRAREAVPTVVALRERFEAIRKAELDRLAPRLSTLTPEAKARVDEITRLIVEKLLLTPTEQLKALGDHDSVVAHSEALNRLFSLAMQEMHAGRPSGPSGDPQGDEGAPR